MQSEHSARLAAPEQGLGDSRGSRRGHSSWNGRPTTLSEHGQCAPQSMGGTRGPKDRASCQTIRMSRGRRQRIEIDNALDWKRMKQRR